MYVCGITSRHHPISAVSICLASSDKCLLHNTRAWLTNNKCSPALSAHAGVVVCPACFGRRALLPCRIDDFRFQLSSGSVLESFAVCDSLSESHLPPHDTVWTCKLIKWFPLGEGVFGVWREVKLQVVAKWNALGRQVDNLPYLLSMAARSKYL